MSDRDPKEVAKQLGTYADAITAFALVHSITFGFALGSTDFRDRVRHTPPAMMPVMCGVAFLFYAVLVIFCHRGEDALIGSSKGSSEVEVWTRNVRRFRIMVIVLAEALALFAVLMTFRH
jgi:hypothetical protein